jgi:tetratricopeptide (TPR) repeat protein
MNPLPLNAEPTPKIQEESKLICPSKIQRAVDAFRQGTGFAEKKKIKEALDRYREAIELDPGFCDPMDQLGLIFQKGDKVDEAIYWHQKAIEANMKDAFAHIQLATDFRLQNRIRESADEYKMAIEIEPQNPEGYFGLGSDYLTIGKNEEALRELKVAEKLYEETKSPYLIHARYSIGLVYYFLDKCVSAKSYLEPIYSEYQNEPNINYSLGVCYLRAKESEKGKRFLEKARSLGMEKAANLLEMIEGGELK